MKPLATGYPKSLLVCFAMMVVFVVGAKGPAVAADENTFVTVQGGKLMIGSKEFFAKGANYIGGRYALPASFNTDANGYKITNQYLMFNTFSAPDIENELKFLKTQLGINVIRLITPAVADLEPWVLYNGWEPWFQTDGSITPNSLVKLKTIIAIAKKYGIRVQFALLWLVTDGSEMATGIPPGSVKENFYKKYLSSLIPVFKNDPTVMSYEISNETLGYPENNPQSLYHPRMLSFTRRMIAHIRSLDPNHLIASGEIIGADPAYSNTWWWPTPEVAVVPDIDLLNGGTSYSLDSLVDYWAPHMYATTPAMADTMAQAIRAKTTKPIILGESGYMSSNPPCQWNESTFAGPQLAMAQAILQAVQNQNLNGSMQWDPYPQTTLIPGQFSAVDLPAEHGYTDECDYANVVGPPALKIRGVFPGTFHVFSAGDLTPLPAAAALKQAYMSKMLNDSQVVSMNAPSQILVGESFQVTVVIRNTGTKPWTAGANYRLGSQNPQDNTTWGTGRVSLAAGETLAPGETKTFTSRFTAPTVSGIYNFQWRMVQEAVEWFGDATPNVAVSVQAQPVNQPPTVSAGSDQSITLPSSASLLGSASDHDGLPNPPGAVTTTWSKLSGPGTVSFGNVSSRSTTALFSAAGTYTLRLTASDSALSATDDVIVTVKTGALQNQAPVVNAGSDLMITLPAGASLAGAAIDDHLPNPPNQLITTWSKLSGPGTVGFGDAGKLITTATFSAQGIYVLRLTASDGALSAGDTLTVNVSAVSGSGLPEPDLSGINDRTFTRNDTLALTYSGNASAFNWEFIPAPSGQASAGVLAPAAPAPVVTATPRFNLSSLSLPPGRYEVRVQAIAAGQQSNWATASITLANDVLAGFRAYPNPVSAARGDVEVIFDRMPANSTVKIFTISGRYVKFLNAPTGTVVWDLTNDSGDKVASGIYFYLISDGQDRKARGKLTLIR